MKPAEAQIHMHTDDTPQHRPDYFRVRIASNKHSTHQGFVHIDFTPEEAQVFIADFQQAIADVERLERDHIGQNAAEPR